MKFRINPPLCRRLMLYPLLAFFLCTSSYKEYDSAAGTVQVTANSRLVLQAPNIQEVLFANDSDCTGAKWNYKLHVAIKPGNGDTPQFQTTLYFKQIPAAGDSLVIAVHNAHGSACKADTVSVTDSLGAASAPDTFSAKLAGVPFDSTIYIDDVNTGGLVDNAEISDKKAFVFSIRWGTHTATGIVVFVILTKTDSYSCFSSPSPGWFDNIM